MKGLLLDTHAFLWWQLDDPRLPEQAREAIAGTTHPVYLSVASIWELAIKVGIGKLPEAAPSLAELAKGSGHFDVEFLQITPAHATGAGLIDIAHRDPFDRLLIFQARSEDLTLVSNEKLFDRFNVNRLWN